MHHEPEQILSILDGCCDAFTFPMLDNGYVYLAATRLVAYRSDQDWALTIEVFGFSPRSGDPDVHVYTFGSKLVSRPTASDYASQEAFERYIANNPNNESSFFYPIRSDWMSENYDEIVPPGVTEVTVRDKSVTIPKIEELGNFNIIPETPPDMRIFELCRYLAATHRAEVLATDAERRTHVPEELVELLRLEEWHHPDVVDDKSRPSNTESFVQVARVLASGDVRNYAPTQKPNTHWSNWPDGGSL